MSTINPIKITGNWVDGYALDYHTRYSIYIGVDEYGHNIYDTKRSDLGELLYELKYRGERNNVLKIGKMIKPFLVEWNISEKIDYIIPVPPSKERKFQPVYELSREIGQIINRNVIFDFLQKDDSNQSKNLSSDQKTQLKGSIQRVKRFKRKVNVLIVDDLYQSGQTLNESSHVLQSDHNINNIYVLAITKTRG